MIRRAALALAFSAVLAVNPTAATSPRRPKPAPEPMSVVLANARHDALQYIAATFRSPYFRRWVETVAYAPDYRLACPYERLIRHTFPDWPDAVAVAWRESRCQPDAANPSSSAGGLFQLLQSLHSHRYYATGACAPSEWADPWCNVNAARDLYDAAGTSPWRTS